MTRWMIDIVVRVTEAELEGMTDAWLSELDAAPSVVGPVTATVPEGRVVGARFALASSDVNVACHDAVSAIQRALTVVGIDAPLIQRITIERTDGPDT